MPSHLPLTPFLRDSTTQISPKSQNLHNMAGPTFPTELLAKVVDCVAEVPEFDFVQPDWAEGVEYTTLKSLCLTSRAFNELATAHLYRHLVLPTAEAGRALVRTVKADKWSKGNRDSKLARTVKVLSVGRQVPFGDEAGGSFVYEVFAAVRYAWIERVAIVGLEVGLELLGRLRCPSVVQLDQCVLHGLGLQAKVWLPSVSHLHLANSRGADEVPGGSAPTDQIFFTGLAHFVTRNTAAAHELILISAMPYFIHHEASSALRSLALLEHFPSLTTLAPHYASHMNSLERLVLAVSPALHPDFPLAFLGGFQHSLKVFDIAVQPLGACLVRAVLTCFEEDRVCVRGLEVLRLPGEEGVSVFAGREDEAAEALVQLAKLAAVAAKQKVKVVWAAV